MVQPRSPTSRNPGVPTSRVPEVDISSWPVVVLDAGNRGLKNLDAQLKELTRLYREHPCAYATVIDASEGAHVSPMHRQRLGEFSREQGEHAKHYCQGMAMVFSSVLMRGVMTAILWMRPNASIPYKVFSTRMDALAWAQARVGSAGTAQPTFTALAAAQGLTEPADAVDMRGLAAELWSLQAELLASEGDQAAVGAISACQAKVTANDRAGLLATVRRHFGVVVQLSNESTPELRAVIAQVNPAALTDIAVPDKGAPGPERRELDAAAFDRPSTGSRQLPQATLRNLARSLSALADALNAAGAEDFALLGVVMAAARAAEQGNVARVRSSIAGKRSELLRLAEEHGVHDLGYRLLDAEFEAAEGRG